MAGLGYAKWDDRVGLIREVRKWTDWFTDVIFVPDDRPGIKFVVADCGFSNLYDLMDSTYKNFHVSWLTPLVNSVMKSRYGYDMKLTSAVDALRENDVPVCFIHGANDSFIKPSNSQVMKEAQKGYGEIHLIDGAEHAQSREIAGEEAYKAIIEEFLGEIGFPDSI